MLSTTANKKKSAKQIINEQRKLIIQLQATMRKQQDTTDRRSSEIRKKIQISAAVLAGTVSVGIIAARKKYSKMLKTIHSSHGDSKEASEAMLTLIEKISSDTSDPESVERIQKILANALGAEQAKWVPFIYKWKAELSVALRAAEKNHPGVLYTAAIAGLRTEISKTPKDFKSDHTSGVIFPNIDERKSKWTEEDCKNFDASIITFVKLLSQNDPLFVKRTLLDLRKFGAIGDTAWMLIEGYLEGDNDLVNLVNDLTSHKIGKNSALATLFDSILVNLPELMQLTLKKTRPSSTYEQNSLSCVGSLELVLPDPEKFTIETMDGAYEQARSHKTNELMCEEMINYFTSSKELENGVFIVIDQIIKKYPSFLRLLQKFTATSTVPPENFSYSGKANSLVSKVAGIIPFSTGYLPYAIFRAIWAVPAAKGLLMKEFSRAVVTQFGAPDATGEILNKVEREKENLIDKVYRMAAKHYNIDILNIEVFDKIAGLVIEVNKLKKT